MCKLESEPVFARLDGERTSIVWVKAGTSANCVYLGRKLPADEDLAALSAARTHGGHENQPDAAPVGGLLPDPATGWRGRALFDLRVKGARYRPEWDYCFIEADEDRLVAAFYEAGLDLEFQIVWQMGAGDVITAATTFVPSQGPGFDIAGFDIAGFDIERWASLLLPLPTGFDHVTHFAGRWADDMRAERLPITRAGLSWASRGGKSAFAGGDYLIFDDDYSGAQIGFHMAHSGDHETCIERNEDGHVTLLAEVPRDYESAPPPLGITTSAEALFAWAPDEAALTHAFHTHARSKLAKSRDEPRKVHFNTWEACGFDFDEARLTGLAEEAAKLGAERFVLDDGWFKGRRSDRTALGDWEPDPDRFPGGLTPLIDHVKALGMDFGLWVEPEMVSPNSDLYRAHPDWCLHGDSNSRPAERNQLVLDLSKPVVFDYVSGCVQKLLANHDIAYLKWDHNRRLFPACGAESLAQNSQFHQLLRDVRKAHPDVMIESCSSGGGRIDFSLLGLCERFWPSDNNDALQRIGIMQNWSRFLPLEVLGNHAGPSPNPITARRLNIDFCAKIALFGHMGVEADPGAMPAEDRAVLAAHIALYKDWRAVLHKGAYYRLPHPDPGIFAHMAAGKTHSLGIAAQTRFAPDFDAAPIRLAGLVPEERYRVTLPGPWPHKARQYLGRQDQWREGLILSGAALMGQGLALPLTHPETAWLIALERLS